jgi:multicomponent Na+:H+ antiporter subunit E
MNLKRTTALSAILFVFWIILAQSFEPQDLIIGLICAIAVSLGSQLLLSDQMESIDLSVDQVFRLALYFPYLLFEIVKANVDVAEIVLDPRLPISPVIVKFKFPLKDDLPQVTLANSITLTPGTLTVDIQDDTFFIHCLAEHHAEAIFDWTLQERTMGIFAGPMKEESQ